MTHDYTAPCWGHDVVLHHTADEGKTWLASGWGMGIATGDHLVVRHPEGGTPWYRVESIRYHGDPRDMWGATLAFDPRPERGGGERCPTTRW